MWPRHWLSTPTSEFTAFVTSAVGCRSPTSFRVAVGARLRGCKVSERTHDIRRVLTSCHLFQRVCSVQTNNPVWARVTLSLFLSFLTLSLSLFLSFSSTSRLNLSGGSLGLRSHDIPPASPRWSHRRACQFCSCITLVWCPSVRVHSLSSHFSSHSSFELEPTADRVTLVRCLSVASAPLSFGVRRIRSYHPR